eukprot:gnl/MRDRNA2_/MRDRNA2_179724_c0_seq1.p1 gnl/MRDRNA2_/MRDRNA2_179724_c0~~gnl/MRDRNA2_/MRDRNA2_179724_c0_seq1.p1  ORF type:complete len:162 (+),score=53.82 gnl/MRDRNA2_/MRDRNA2_179724_c0_seq1:147-632(+)
MLGHSTPHGFKLGQKISKGMTLEAHTSQSRLKVAQAAILRGGKTNLMAAGISLFNGDAEKMSLSSLSPAPSAQPVGNRRREKEMKIKDKERKKAKKKDKKTSAKQKKKKEKKGKKKRKQKSSSSGSSSSSSSEDGTSKTLQETLDESEQSGKEAQAQKRKK